MPAKKKVDEKPVAPFGVSGEHNFPKDKNGATMSKDNKGLRVPSVTTIIGESLGGWGKEALLYWSWNLGMQGKDYREERKAAADVGTIAHAMIDGFINNEDPDFSKYLEQENFDELMVAAEVPFELFLDWYMTNNVNFLATEVQMISHVHSFGGTMDGKAEVNGKKVLLDYKSSKHIYTSIIAQLGGYAILDRETSKEMVNDFVAIHIGKQGQFGVYEFDRNSVDDGIKLFHHAHSIFKMKKQLDARIKIERDKNAAAYPFEEKAVDEETAA